MSKSARRRPPPNNKPGKAPPPPAAAPARKPPLLVWVALAAVVVATIAGTILLWPQPPGPGPSPGRGGGPRLLAQVNSLYNDISIYQQPDGLELMTFGAKRLHYVESMVNPEDELDLPVAYTQSMTAGLAYASELTRAAIIGLGGGRTAWYYHKSVPDLDFTAAELDPAVVQLAGQYFDVHPEKNFAIAVEDGRVWLTKTDKDFDVILIDAYRGPFVPFHLLTTEFYQLVARHLRPGGVAVQNVEPTTMLFDSAVATIKSAFQHVVFLKGEGNIVILAYNGPEKDEATLQRQAAERTGQYHLRYPLTDILARRFTPQWNEATKPLTDDFAPVEYLKAIARHNEKQP
jgi:spermidine synthase